MAEADRRQRRSAGIARRKRARKRNARRKPERLPVPLKKIVFFALCKAELNGLI